jgi:hypothetical protein
MVNVLATGSMGRGFKPSQDDGFLMAFYGMLKNVALHNLDATSAEFKYSTFPATFLLHC